MSSRNRRRHEPPAVVLTDHEAARAVSWRAHSARLDLPGVPEITLTPLQAYGIGLELLAAALDVTAAMPDELRDRMLSRPGAQAKRAPGHAAPAAQRAGQPTICPSPSAGCLQ